MSRFAIILLSLLLYANLSFSTTDKHEIRQIAASPAEEHESAEPGFLSALPSGYSIVQASDGAYYINPPYQYHHTTWRFFTRPVIKLAIILIGGVGIFIANTVRYRKSLKQLDKHMRRRRARETNATKIVNPVSEQIVCPGCNSFTWATEDVCPTCGKKLRE